MSKIGWSLEVNDDWKEYRVFHVIPVVYFIVGKSPTDKNGFCVGVQWLRWTIGFGGTEKIVHA